MNITTLKVEPIKLKSLGEGLGDTSKGGTRVFIPSARPPEPEAPPPPPTFSEAELKTAERDGYQKGFLEGVKEGHSQAQNEQASINSQVAALGANFTNAILPIFRDYQKFNLLLREQVTSVAMAIAKKIAGAALQENAHLQVAEIATRACETMMSEARLTITAHESLGDRLETMLQNLAARLPEHTEIIIQRDPTIPISDCRIDWKLGCMQHSTKEMWERVEKALESISATALRDGEAAMQALQNKVLTGESGENEVETKKDEPPEEPKE